MGILNALLRRDPANLAFAVLVSKAKTQITPNRDIDGVAEWGRLLASEASIRQATNTHPAWTDSGYLKHLNDRATWRIRKMIAIALDSLASLANEPQETLARMSILRTAQWALDNRRCIPTVWEFRETLQNTANEITNSVREYSCAARAARRKYRVQGSFRPVCMHRSAIGIEKDCTIASLKVPKLVLTSPPYPGVHILYHRWQVQGRRESPAPFWIANSLDGEGASYYTFGDRNSVDLKTYFFQAEAAFRSIASICDSNTIVVQMIAFSQPKWQLPAYLVAMEPAGLREVAFGSSTLSSRLWRKVPYRRWYASWRDEIPSSKEIVLFHQLAERKIATAW